MKNNFHYILKCVSCGKEHKESESYTRCLKCGDSLDVVYDYDKISERLNIHMLKTAPLKAMKYLDFYPLNDLRKVITLYEGGTSLYKCKNLGEKLGMKNLYIKNEGLNPTGAFKDRGTMVEVTKALEMNKKAIICASTGNMAASVSAYAAKAKIPCHIMVPEGTPIGKMSQTLSYGARIVQIRGTYDDCVKLSVEISQKHNFFLAGDYTFRLEGQKSCGFEIAEQLNWKSPSKVIMPVGCGTNLSAVWKGFKEFHMIDLISKLPSMVAVQAHGANPVAEAFNNGSKKWKIIEKPQTVASAMCVGNPLDGTKTLNALSESNGAARSVNDDSILEAEKMLAKEESVFVEPSGASTLAALIEMLNEGAVDKDEEVVLVLTGVGLKDPISALKVLPSPPSAEPDYNEVSKFLNYGYYNVYANTASQNIIFQKLPNQETLRMIIKKSFDLDLSSTDLNECINSLKGFEEKGKSVMETDLRLVLENILNKQHLKERALKVLDFKIVSVKHNRPEAFIVLNYLGKKITDSDSGVGPVDAIIKAITKSLSSNGFKFRLTDYNVAINSRGTDAVVDVKMTLMDDNNNKVIAIGTSRDIIVASIEAFEEGYNILHMKNKKQNSNQKIK